MTRGQAIALVLTSASCLVAVMLPQSVQREVVYVERKPLMFEKCAMSAEEYSRICRARVLSERVKEKGKRL